VTNAAATVALLVAPWAENGKSPEALLAMKTFLQFGKTVLL